MIARRVTFAPNSEAHAASPSPQHHSLRMIPRHSTKGLELAPAASALMESARTDLETAVTVGAAATRSIERRPTSTRRRSNRVARGDSAHGFGRRIAGRRSVARERQQHRRTVASGSVKGCGARRTIAFARDPFASSLPVQRGGPVISANIGVGTGSRRKTKTRGGGRSVGFLVMTPEEEARRRYLRRPDMRHTMNTVERGQPQQGDGRSRGQEVQAGG